MVRLYLQNHQELADQSVSNILNILGESTKGTVGVLPIFYPFGRLRYKNTDRGKGISLR